MYEAPANVNCSIYPMILYLLRIFVGYCFKSAEEIKPFAEDRLKGKTVQWAAKQGTYSGSSCWEFTNRARSNRWECECEYAALLELYRIYTEEYSNWPPTLRSSAIRLNAFVMVGYPEVVYGTFLHCPSCRRCTPYFKFLLMKMICVISWPRWTPGIL